MRGNGRKHTALRCLGKVTPRLTCRPHRAARGLILGTARASSLIGARISRSFESELYPAAVLLCYSGWLFDFIRRWVRRCQRKAMRQQLSCPLKPAAEAFIQVQAARVQAEGSLESGVCVAYPQSFARLRLVFLGYLGQKEGRGWEGKRGGGKRSGKEDPLRRGRCVLWSALGERIREVQWFTPPSPRLFFFGQSDESRAARLESPR